MIKVSAIDHSVLVGSSLTIVKDKPVTVDVSNTKSVNVDANIQTHRLNDESAWLYINTNAGGEVYDADCNIMKLGDRKPISVKLSRSWEYMKSVGMEHPLITKELASLRVSTPTTLWSTLFQSGDSVMMDINYVLILPHAHALTADIHNCTFDIHTCRLFSYIYDCSWQATSMKWPAFV